MMNITTVNTPATAIVNGKSRGYLHCYLCGRKCNAEEYVLHAKMCEQCCGDYYRLLKAPTLYHLRKYNVTNLWFLDKLIEQKGRCDICMRSRFKLKKELGVDHNHKCCPGGGSCGRCVRGLLCNRCNIALGLLDDLTVKANRLIKYINKYNI